MPEPGKNCEYFLAYYAPSALRETRVPIGLLLFEDSGRLVGRRFTEDWRAVRCLDPQADLNLLGMISAHLDRLASEALERSPDSERSMAPASFSETLQRMEREFAGSLQISPPRAVHTNDPEQELDRLFAEHVAPRRALLSRTTARPGSRSWVRAQLAEALRRHDLWDRFERDVSVEQFTAPGDGFRMDFRYQPNGVAHYLHALSLERDWTQAKLLGYTYWRIRERTEARLTAIVADTDPEIPRAQSCRRILTEARIAVEPLARLDPFLETLRQQFGLR